MILRPDRSPDIRVNIYLGVHGHTRFTGHRPSFFIPFVSRHVPSCRQTPQVVRRVPLSRLYLERRTRADTLSSPFGRIVDKHKATFPVFVIRPGFRFRSVTTKNARKANKRVSLGRSSSVRTRRAPRVSFTNRPNIYIYIFTLNK